jgi:hypothetical protein
MGRRNAEYGPMPAGRGTRALSRSSPGRVVSGSRGRVEGPGSRSPVVGSGRSLEVRVSRSESWGRRIRLAHVFPVPSSNVRRDRSRCSSEFDPRAGGTSRPPRDEVPIPAFAGIRGSCARKPPEPELNSLRGVDGRCVRWPRASIVSPNRITAVLRRQIGIRHPPRWDEGRSPPARRWNSRWDGPDRRRSERSTRSRTGSPGNRSQGTARTGGSRRAW